MKILFTGGGSGGHFYPLIAVAEEINRITREEKLIKAELYFMSDSKYDAQALFRNDITFLAAPAGKARRYFSLKNFSDLFKTGLGLLKGLYSVFNLFPDVIFSKGGYASVPALFAARLFRIPVFMHESDSVPGRVSLWAGKFALRIAVSFPEAAQYFRKDRVALTGNPVRAELRNPVSNGAFENFRFDPNVPTILIIGGSLGAELINNMIMDILPKLVENYQVIHQTGRRNIGDVQKISSVALKDNPHKGRYICYEFLDDATMRMAAGAAGLVISRAGSSIFEIAIWGKPSIIIPITDSNGDHQRKNALSYLSAGACAVIEEANLKPHILLSQIEKIFGSRELQENMAAGAKQFAKPQAAEKIAREIINICLTHEV